MSRTNFSWSKRAIIVANHLFRALSVALFLTLTVAVSGTAFAQTFTVIKQFSPTDGGGVQGNLLLSGSVLYGAAQVGGNSSVGTLFKVNTDGSGYTVLRHFTGFTDDGNSANDDGALPAAGMLLSSGVLYGTTMAGGTSNYGTIYKINNDGSGYSILHHFTGVANKDGASPVCQLVQVGVTLYGTTTAGGTNDFGTIFKVNMDGTGYAVLKHFAGGNDGALPAPGLVAASGVLYGVTAVGGNSDKGTVFKINIDGSGYSTLKHFAGGAGDGAMPAASLILSGNTLYGTTQAGGAAALGTVFKIGTDGTGFAVLKEFAGGVGGAGPAANVTLDGSTLYGTTQSGGSSEQGTVFSVGTNGSDFTVIKYFDFGNEGSFPAAGLVMNAGSLYGTTVNGGASEVGTLFRITVFEVNSAPTDISLSSATIAENNPPNATVGTLSATDPNSSQTHTFTLVSGAGSADNGAFTITNNKLTINSSANFETKNSYSIRIRATDNGTPSASFEKPFTITITDVNEAPTDIALSNSSITENNALNTTIGAFSATDPENGQTQTFTLVSGTGGDDNSGFTITGSTLKITTIADFETKSSYSIRVRATDNGTPPASFEKVFTISVIDVQNPQTITFGPLASKTFGNPPFTVAGTATSGLPLSFSILSGPATISGNLVTLTGAGSVTVRASQAGGNDFNAAPNVDQSFNVAKASQTISFTTPADRLIENSPFTLTSTASSGLPVTFSISSGPATLSGDAVTLSGVGEVTVRASQPGNANYIAAANVDRSFLVSRFTKFVDFSGAANGSNPFGNLFQATDGNFYGTTFAGGANGLGAVFRMSPVGTVSKLADFSGSANGASPAASLVQDSDGSLWGLTVYGGANNLGTVFKITPAGVLTRMASFGGATTGANPFGGVVQGPDNNFYGMTSAGGANNLGTLFMITRTGVLTKLLDFNGAINGGAPLGGLTRIGTSYFGVTSTGGVNNKGLLFIVSTDGTPAGTAFTKLMDFNGAEFGAAPKGDLTVVPDGTDGGIYVLTTLGGTANYGTLIKHTGFGAPVKVADLLGAENGANPHGALVRATNGNFFGVAYAGGANNLGTIFRLTPGGTLSTMASFSAGTSANGANPFDSLMQGADGAFYGTTSAGGANNLGTIFKLDVGLPVQNNAPTDITLSKATIAENNAANAIIGNLSASDVDSGQTNTFTLVDGPGSTDNNFFTITGSNLTINASANFEVKSSYNIRVMATDSGTPALSIEKPFTITVINVNEAPTDITLSNNTIGENNAANAIIGNLSASDPDDGQSHTFTLVSGTGSADNNSFSIVGNTLRINASADFETRNTYGIRVRATDNGVPATFFDKIFTILITDVQNPQTITFGPLANKTMGVAPFTISATASSTLPVSFSILSGPATINGNVVSLTGVGTVTVRASQVGGNDFNAASPVDQSFTVTKGNQTITFNPPSSKVFGVDGPFQLTATASSQLAPVFSIVSGPATISGNTVTLTGEGTLTVRASQAGNANYNAAPDETRTITVSAPPNIAPRFTLGQSWTPRIDGNWTSMASSADGTKLVACSSGDRIYTSTNSGVTWVARESRRKWVSVASSADGTKLVAAAEFGLIYTSTDSGVTWVPRESNRRWSSVASSADGTRLVAIDNYGKIYTSINSGATWTAREQDRPWESVASSADGSKLVAVTFYFLENSRNGQGIYTSTDSGLTWVGRETRRLWRSVASSADGTKLVAAASFTTEPDQIYTSTDSGVTWTPRESQRQWHSVASSADGNKLVAVERGGRVFTSIDSGVTWAAGGDQRLWNCVASSADGTKLVAGDQSSSIFTLDASFNQSVADGAGQQIVSNLVQNIDAGSPSELGQVVDFQVANDNNNLFDVQPYIDASNTSSPGALHYTPKIGQSGTATVSVKAHDNGPTDNGGVNLSGAQSFTITVFPSVNISGSDATARSLNNQTLANTSGGKITLSGSTTLSGSMGLARGPVTLSGTVSVNGGTTLSVAGTNELTITGSMVANPAGSTLVKTGPGKLVIDSTTFNGSISVLEGTVEIRNANFFGCFFLGGTATLQGNGTFNCLISKAGSTIRPGASPGTLTANDDVTWEGGATYAWEINNATGIPGVNPGWDLINSSGALTLNATPENPYTVLLKTLTMANPDGPMANFDNNTPYSWRIASAAGGINGFQPAAINLDTNGIANDLAGGSFTITKQNGTNLVVSFIPASQLAPPTDIRLSSVVIAEANSALATVGLITAVDANAADNHKFTLVSGAGSTDNASFTILGNALQALPVFDYNTKNSYTIRLRATDAGGLFFEKTFVITITKVAKSLTFKRHQSTFVEGNLQFSLDGTANTSWRLEASSNLVDWTILSTNKLGFDGIFNFVDPDSSSFSRRYYRSSVVSP